MSKLRLILASALAPFVAFTTTSYAAIAESDLAPITTEITSTIATLLPWAIGLIVAVMVPTLGLGLLKKFGKRAAS